MRILSEPCLKQVFSNVDCQTFCQLCFIIPCQMSTPLLSLLKGAKNIYSPGKVFFWSRDKPA